MTNDDDASLSRRHVLAGMAAGLVSACSSSSSAPDAAPEAATKAAAAGQALAHGEMDRWSGYVGTRFEASGFQLRLSGVRPLASEGARPANVSRSSAFLAVFDVDGGRPMPGNLIHALRAQGVGPLDVFLADAATPEFPGRMHAVFN